MCNLEWCAAIQVLWQWYYCKCCYWSRWCNKKFSKSVDRLEDGYRFTPNGNNDYIIDQIEYQPVITGNTVTWLDINGNIIGSGNTITVNPTESTTYFAQAQLCVVVCRICGGTVEDGVNIFLKTFQLTMKQFPHHVVGI